MLNVSYMRLENNVCSVGAKLFITHQKPSRPLQLTQMGLRLGGKQWASVKKTDLSLSLSLHSLSIFLALSEQQPAKTQLSKNLARKSLHTADIKDSSCPAAIRGHGSHPRDIYGKCASVYQWWKSLCEERCSRLPWCSMVNITIACSSHEDITLTDILSVSQAVKLVTWRCDFTLFLTVAQRKQTVDLH